MKTIISLKRVDFTKFLPRNHESNDTVEITEIYLCSLVFFLCVCIFFSGKNFVKATFLLGKLLNSWFDEFLFVWKFRKFNQFSIFREIKCHYNSFLDFTKKMEFWFFNNCYFIVAFFLNLFLLLYSISRYVVIMPMQTFFEKRWKKKKQCWKVHFSAFWKMFRLSLFAVTFILQNT